MSGFVAAKNLIELERLRNRLYSVVNGDQCLLKSREACEVSHELDKLIVNHMCKVQRKKNRQLINN